MTGVEFFSFFWLETGCLGVKAFFVFSCVCFGSRGGRGDGDGDGHANESAIPRLPSRLFLSQLPSITAQAFIVFVSRYSFPLFDLLQLLYSYHFLVFGHGFLARFSVVSGESSYFAVYV